LAGKRSKIPQNYVVSTIVFSETDITRQSIQEEVTREKYLALQDRHVIGKEVYDDCKEDIHRYMDCVGRFVPDFKFRYSSLVRHRRRMQAKNISRPIRQPELASGYGTLEILS
jgi:hypothetical protein